LSMEKPTKTLVNKIINYISIDSENNVNIHLNLKPLKLTSGLKSYNNEQ